MEQQSNNAAKYAFFYLLSLVALIFMSLSTGMIIFQIINKNIADVLNQYSGRYSPEALKFAISAIIISAPIFYFVTAQIYKSLYSGRLHRDSGIRKWLTYFILLISSVVMIGWLIGTINSFLDGELTTKFLLKAITAIVIAAGVFTFYLYDIKRDEVEGKKDKVIRAYFYGSLIVVIAVFVGSLFIVESPTETRNRKLDSATLGNFDQIYNAVDSFYRDYNKMPASLDEIRQEFTYINQEDLEDPATKELYEYKITGKNSFELCATFRTSNLEADDLTYQKETWPHDVGYQCLGQKIRNVDDKAAAPLPAFPIR